MFIMSSRTRMIRARAAPVMIPQMRRLLRLWTLPVPAAAGSVMLRSFIEMALSVKTLGLS